MAGKKTQNTASKAAQGDASKLKIIPLGGVNEIGKNMTVIEYEDDIVVVDCGSAFPQEDMLGIDLVIPDITYLEKNKERIRGFLLTHGHEDHIGATPYVLREIKAPAYGTRLTLALVEHKLKERHIRGADLRRIQPGDVIKLGAFTVEFIKVNHSIAGSVALAIHTPVGTVVHTGDFKVDYTPVDGEVIGLGEFARLGNQGVLALLSDSTNAERPGFTMSERHIADTFDTFIRRAKGRVVVATFASNIHRIQQVVDVAARYGRKICFSGRSIVNISKVAMELGELRIPDNMMIDLDQVRNYDPGKVAVLTTGSQGEVMSGLVRMSINEHKLEIQPGDTVIISATPIPGNEKFVSRVIDNLYRIGANVIYDAMAQVHVSGHACQQELMLIHALTKPKYFIPTHGEYRHLMQHAKLAEAMGMPVENIFITEIGDVIELGANSGAVESTVPAGKVLVDGLGIGDVGNVVLRDRRHLSQDGLMAVVVALSKESGMIAGGPDIISRGFVYVRESEKLMEEARDVVRDIVEQARVHQIREWSSIKTAIRSGLHDFLYDKTKRSPMILPILLEV